MSLLRGDTRPLRTIYDDHNAEGITAYTGRLGALRWPERDIIYDC